MQHSGQISAHIAQPTQEAPFLNRAGLAPLRFNFSPPLKLPWGQKDTQSRQPLQRSLSMTTFGIIAF